MKIVRFTTGEQERYGVLENDIVRVLQDKPFKEIIFTGENLNLVTVKLLAPCQPSKIVAVGLNYKSHAKEFKSPLPDAPLIFLKPSTAVIGPEDDIVYPESTNQVDYEAELAVVIKKPVWRVKEAQASDYILGYTCFNDVTARDLQKHDLQWTRAKSFNTFAAVGPWIETELNYRKCSVETYLNGHLKQTGRTSDLLFQVPQLLSFISHVMTLLPGDIIATGTPSGVGPMQPGDTVEIKIGGIGNLRNYVVRQAG